MTKSINILYWLFTGLFAAFMLMSAIPNITRSPEAVEAFKHLGYPQYLLPFIGVAKVLGVLVVLIPGFKTLKEWAYAGLCFDLLGAMYSSASVKYPLAVLGFQAIGLVLLFLSYLFYRKRKRPVQADENFLVTVSEAFAKGDIKAIHPFLATNITWNILGEKPVVGKEEVLQVLRMSQLQSYPDVTLNSVLKDGNAVIIESNGKATTTTGKPYNQSYCDIYRFENNQLIQVTTYLDTALSKSVSN